VSFRGTGDDVGLGVFGARLGRGVVGAFVGVFVGAFVGPLVGAFVGAFVGVLVGARVGFEVGGPAGASVLPRPARYKTSGLLC
jgi:hypothetical protein